MSPRADDRFDAYALRRRDGKGGRQLALRGQVGLTGANPEERTAWVHVAPVGTWEGHAAGAFSLTSSDFDSIVTHDREREAPIPWDYEHASIEPTGQPTPAAGYVTQLESRDDGLWAKTEFTQRAAQMVRDGEYRFCSGVFDFDAADPVSGEQLSCVLDSIALTNRPFIAGMEPIQLTKKSASRTRRSAAQETPRMPTPIPNAKGVKFSRKALDVALNGLDSDELTPASIQAIVEGLTSMARAKAALTTEPDMADGSDGSSDGGADGSDGGGAAASLGRRSNGIPPVQGAPQNDDEVANEGTDPAPETPTTAPPTEQGGSMLQNAVSPPDATTPPEDAEPPGMPDDTQTDLALMDLMKATGLDDAGMAQAIKDNMDDLVALLTGAADAASLSLSRKGRDLVVATLQKSLAESRRQLNEKDAIIATSQKTSREATISAEVDGLVKSGRIHPRDKAAWTALCRSDSKAFATAKATLQPVYPTGRAPAAPPPSSGGPEAIAPTSSVDGPIDPKDPRVIECSTALDHADRELVRMGRKAMSKEARDVAIRRALKALSSPMTAQ